MLQLYNCVWLHHELCSTLFSNPRKQTLNHLFGVYLHDLVVHAPLQYEAVCLRSTNAESQERLFSQAKHISLRATNRKPENVLPTILLSLQARGKMGDTQQSVRKQDSIVSSAAKRLPPFEGTFVESDFIARRIPSWQAHLQRISMFLQYGENVWWKYENNGYRFFDSDSDRESQPQGPSLSHFSQVQLIDIEKQHSETWDSIITNKTKLPSPHIRLYDKDGNCTGTRFFLTTDNTECNQQTSDMEYHTAQTSHILESNSTVTTTLDDTQSSGTKTNHNHPSTPVIFNTNTPISECTPSSSSQMQPITLFRTQDKNSPSNSSESPTAPESSPSNDTDEEVEDVLQDIT